jgi:hypothetical protein
MSRSGVDILVQIHIFYVAWVVFPPPPAQQQHQTLWPDHPAENHFSLFYYNHRCLL